MPALLAGLQPRPGKAEQPPTHPSLAGAKSGAHLIPRRVRWAVFAGLLLHGLFILSARYRTSYDAYTHMLFADHYATGWFSLWEPRWYGGFTMVAYPPLAHQLTALLIPFVGFDTAFALILWLVAGLYPLAVYAFSRIFIGRTGASYAALASALLLPIYVTAYIFGQLPFLAATLLALFGAAALARYLREGRGLDLGLAVSLFATMVATHHATLLVEPFLILAVLAGSFEGSNPRTILARLVSFGLPALISGFIVIWPFWQWGVHQTLQTPIDHLSRHNFLADPAAADVFFWPMYGPLVAVIPFVLWKWPRRFWGLAASFVLLFLLGLGGTTSLPRLLFGQGWQWLTYDRFAFWAALSLLPFFAALWIMLRRRWRRQFAGSRTPLALRTDVSFVLLFAVFGISALGVWFSQKIFPTQPAAIDMHPIVDFLNQGDRSQWRYLTFGFGDQFGYLNLLTTATTIDGSYHTARTIPVLRESGVGEIDTALWTPGGVAAIDPILKASSAYGVRWGFVNRPDYVPELEKDGWLYRLRLSNGVEVWENPTAIPQAPADPPPIDPLAAFTWGTLPLLSLICTLTLGSLRVWHIRAERIIREVHAFLVGLIPIGFCFWYYRVLWESPYKQFYFTYDSAIFFLCDAPALLAVILWLSVRLSGPPSLPRSQLAQRGDFLSVTFLLLCLCSLATLSILWSAYWQTSLYIAIHLWLAFGLYLSLRDWPDVWKPLTLGLTAALAIEILAGYAGFLAQSTAFLAPLGMNWPGVLDVAVQGASILVLPNGDSVLRAYGTFPHPNILGGFALAFLLGPIALFLRGRKISLVPALLLGAGIGLVGLSFSRSAWLGVIAVALILVWKSKYLDRKRLLALGFIGILAIVLTVLPTRELVMGRVLQPGSRLEDLSLTSRLWVAREAASMIVQHPLTGAGIGVFTGPPAQLSSFGSFIEPVHDLPLLIGSELGIPGLLLVVGIAIAVVRQTARARSVEGILVSAILGGLGIVALLDHFLWTLAPGRLMLGLVLGLWAGQTKRNDSGDTREGGILI